jgi:hypothetical protein
MPAATLGRTSRFCGAPTALATLPSIAMVDCAGGRSSPCGAMKAKLKMSTTTAAKKTIM